MSKLILMSFMIAMIAIPARAARHPSPRKGLRKALVNLLFFYLFYAFSLFYLWGRF